MKLTAATVYKLTVPIDIRDLAEADLDDLMVQDPPGAAWSSIGLYAGKGTPEQQFPIISGDERAITFAVQINERILPGSVRDEVVKQRVEQHQAQTGRKVGKKEYRIIRDDVEAELLPKAFIRRALTLVSLSEDSMVIWSSSVGRCDGVMAVMQRAMVEAGIEDVFFKRVNEFPSLTLMASSESGDFPFVNGNNAVLFKHDEEKPVVRVKAVPVDGHDVQQLLKEGYEVKEIELGSEKIQFTLDDKGTFKKISVGVKDDEHAGFEALLFITLNSLLDAADDLNKAIPDDDGL